MLTRFWGLGSPVWPLSRTGGPDRPVRGVRDALLAVPPRPGDVCATMPAPAVPTTGRRPQRRRRLRRRRDEGGGVGGDLGVVAKRSGVTQQ